MDTMEEVSSSKYQFFQSVRNLSWGVPKTTTYRLSGRVLHGTNPGPKPLLHHSEEKESIDHLTMIGGGKKTRREVLHIVDYVAVDKRILRKAHISGGWW